MHHTVLSTAAPINLPTFPTQDIADYVLNPGQMSDSEMEDTPENRVVLSQKLPGRGNRTAQKVSRRCTVRSAIHLHFKLP